MRASLFRRELLVLLLLVGLLALTWGQDSEEDDDDETATKTQVEEEFFEDGQENEADDIAVGAVFHLDSLYVAITTDAALLEEDNVGGVDFIIKIFDTDLGADDYAHFGGDGDDYVTAIASSDDKEEVVIVGSTDSEDDHLFSDLLDTPTGATDWFIATLDRDLATTAAYVNGTNFDTEEAHAVVIADDGFIVAGLTFGDYFDDNVGTDNDGDVGSDFWVLKMSEDLSEEEWGVQYGTVVSDKPSAMVLDDDGNVFVVGTSTDGSDDFSDSEKEELTSMFVYHLDGTDGSILWQVDEDLGFLSDESAAYGAVLSEDKTELYVSGNTKGIIPGYEGDSTDSDELFLVSLDVSDGATNWVWQSEANATAYGTGGVVLASDGLPILGGVAFGNLFNLSYIYWEYGSGDMIAVKIDTEADDGPEVSKYYVAAAASTDTREQALAMVVDEDDEDGVFLFGQENGQFDDEDLEAEDTWNYLLLKVVLEDLPEEEDESDSGWDFPYWYVGVPVFALGGVFFLVAYKWAAASKAAQAKMATMV